MHPNARSGDPDRDPAEEGRAQERLLAPADVLEGALIRVTAFANLTRSPVQLVLAEKVLRDFIPDGSGRRSPRAAGFE